MKGAWLWLILEIREAGVPVEWVDSEKERGRTFCKLVLEQFFLQNIFLTYLWYVAVFKPLKGIPSSPPWQITPFLHAYFSCCTLHLLLSALSTCYNLKLRKIQGLYLHAHKKCLTLLFHPRNNLNIWNYRPINHHFFLFLVISIILQFLSVELRSGKKHVTNSLDSVLLYDFL